MWTWIATSRWPRLLGLGMAIATLSAVTVFVAGHRFQVKSLYREAEEKWKEGLYEESIVLFQKLSEEYPDDPLAGEALFRTGSTYYLFLGRDRQAIETFRALIRRGGAGPWIRRAQGKLGEIFEKRLGDYRQAIVEYQRYINLFPKAEGNDQAQLAVARSYFLLGDFDQAREEYEILLDGYPESPLRDQGLAGMANVLFVTRRYRDAVNYYRLVQQESGEASLVAEAGFSIAGCYEEAGDLERALEEFEKVRESYPNPVLVEQRLERIRKRIEKKGL